MYMFSVFAEDKLFLFCRTGVFLFIIAADLSAVMNYFAVCCSAPTVALPFSFGLYNTALMLYNGYIGRI